MTTSTSPRTATSSLLRPHHNNMAIPRKLQHNDLYIDTLNAFENEQQEIPKIYTIQQKENLSNNYLSPMLRFSGESDDNIDDWLRQFNYLLAIENNNHTEKTLHLYAASFLIGKAGKFFDEMKPEPKSWQEFTLKMKNRFQYKRNDQASLYLKILTRKQKNEEDTKDFIRDVARMAEDVQMPDELTIQTIIKN
ncbi:hypothetical protein GVAV_002744 [Gurleya vavrai]